jgi:hypothetical protein
LHASAWNLPPIESTSDLRLAELPILDIDFSELHLRRVEDEKRP